MFETKASAWKKNEVRTIIKLIRMIRHTRLSASTEKTTKQSQWKVTSPRTTLKKTDSRDISEQGNLYRSTRTLHGVWREVSTTVQLDWWLKGINFTSHSSGSSRNGLKTGQSFEPFSEVWTLAISRQPTNCNSHNCLCLNEPFNSSEPYHEQLKLTLIYLSSLWPKNRNRHPE